MESLQNNVLSGSTHELEIERLRSELRQYDEEFQRLKNQDITIRRLEDSLQELREQNESKILQEVKDRVGDIEEKCIQRVKEVERQCREETRMSERRLQAANENMQRALDSADRAQTQLFEVSSANENRLSALLAENSLLAEGTLRYQVRLAELERQLSERDKAGGNLPALSQDGDQETAGQTLQLVVADLREELKRQEDLLRVEKQRSEAIYRENTSLLQREREAAARLRQELSQSASREELQELRRQVKLLRQIAFHTGETDCDDDLATSSISKGIDGIGASVVALDSQPEDTNSFRLEVLLTARLKAVEAELTSCKRYYS